MILGLAFYEPGLNLGQIQGTQFGIVDGAMEVPSVSGSSDVKCLSCKPLSMK